jgi:hypothetical protein
MKLTWIPGHVDIDGNEQLDKEAKRAATDPSLSRPFNRGTLKSVRIQQIKLLAQKQWNDEWTNHTKTATLLRRHDRARSEQSTTEISEAEEYAQLRTGHCTLNDYLHRFGKADSPFCECGYRKETVQHYLLECRWYKNEKKKLRHEVGIGRMKIVWLLGNKNMASHIMEYVDSTGRLQSR